MEELSIKVSIANREYPLKISSTEEDVVRRAAEIVNSRVKSLTENYTVRDKQDLLAMCALQFATETITAKSVPDDNVNRLVQNMNQLLDKTLSGEE